MSVISLPRRVEDTRRRRPLVTTSPRGVRAPATQRQRWRSASSSRRAVIALAVAMAVSLGGSMWVANRQIEIHTLQSQLLQEQSNYAVQVGSLTNLSAPSQIATQAGALHLVDPVSVTQVPTTSLDKPLPLPKFLGYAPATSRTIR
ncbi:MAG TPA: hypothetical protein VMU98_05690 [Acidimicrobiales bacterium]|nr:hypothetical protein [Acidimicrobiales bacterium]